MDYAGRQAAIFRGCAKEIRASAAAMRGEEGRDQLMKLVEYYEQMATSYEDRANLKSPK